MLTQKRSLQAVLNRGIADHRRALWLALLMTLISFAFFLTGDRNLMIGYAVMVVAPLVLLFLPKEPVIGIPLMFIATGFDAFGSIVEAGSAFTLTYFHVTMVLTFLSVFLNKLLRNDTRIPTANIWPPLLAFLTMMAVSLLYTKLFIDGFLELVRLSVLLLLALSVMICVDTEKRTKLVIWSFIIVPALVSAYSIYEIITEGSFFASAVTRVATELGIPVFRSTGTFRNPNVMACFLMTGVTIGFGELLAVRRSLIKRVLLVVLVSVTSIGVIASFSRAGWLSTGVAVFLVVLFHRRWKYFAVFAAIIGVVLLVLSIKFPQILIATFDRFISIFNPFAEESSSSRISLIKTGFWMWQDHPLMGVGAGSHPYYAPYYTDPNMPPLLLWVVDPHTIQLKILAEEGIIGLTIATWFVMTVLIDGFRSVKTMANDYFRHLQIAFIALFIGFIVNFTFGQDMLNNMFWISVGVMYALPLVDLNEQKRTQDLLPVTPSIPKPPAQDP